jgi:hypothetical protein
VYFGTADTDASVARVQANGGPVVFEPIDHPYGRLSTVADDQGAQSSLLGLSPSKCDAGWRVTGTPSSSGHHQTCLQVV